MPQKEIIPDLWKDDNPDNRRLANLVDGKLWDELKKSVNTEGGLAEFEKTLEKLLDK